MKKFIYSLATLFVVALASVSICSCGSDDDDTPAVAKEITVRYETGKYLNGGSISFDGTQTIPADSLADLIQARVKVLVGGDTFKLASNDGKNPTDVALAALNSKLTSDAEIIRLKKEILSIMDNTGKVAVFSGVYVWFCDNTATEAWEEGKNEFWFQYLKL